MKKVILGFFLLAALAISWTSVKHGFGSIGGYSNSPGDGETCTVCHPNNIRPAGYWVSPVNMPANGYTPGDTLRIFLMATQDGMKNAGFEMRAEDSQQNSVGEFLIVDTVQTRKTAFGSITHTDDGHETNSGLKTWLVDLAVPLNAPDTFTLYTSFNLNNGGYGVNDTTRTSALKLYKTPTANISDSDDINLQIYPNPCAEGFHMKGVTSASEVRIYNAKGQLVKQLKAQEYIPMNDLPQGMYFVHVQVASHHTIHKLLKKD